MGTLVIVDGWNHFLAARRCFGYEVARHFPIDRLAAHLADRSGTGPTCEVVVVMALPDRNRPEEEREFHAWRSKFKKLANFGVEHDRVRFSYLDAHCSHCRAALSREASCTNCGERSQVDKRRKEKGADIQIAVRAVDATWRESYSGLVLLSQDSDFGPLVRNLKEVHRQQSRVYNLYSAFPTCSSSEHEHRGVPGLRELPLNREVYADLSGRPPCDPRPDS